MSWQAGSNGPADRGHPAGAFGHWCGAGEALEVLDITFEAFSIIADLGHQAGSQFGRMPVVRCMLFLTTEELLALLHQTT